MTIVVIGSGIGGLAAALRLRASGHEVTIVEARDDAGGLAGSVSAAGLTFDAGPYVLLDRPGLEWALGVLGVDIGRLGLQPLELVYEVTWEDEAPPVRIWSDLARTAGELDRSWSGAGKKYERFVTRMARRYEQLAPMLRSARPGPMELLRRGAVTAVPFLLRSLAGVMRGSGLPQRVVDALTIWTHVAGQSLRTAPSPMAFVPALIHTRGAWVPRDGTAAIGRLLRQEAQRRGIIIRYGTRVTSIVLRDDRAVGVAVESGEVIASDGVVSNHSAIGTHVDLLAATPEPARRALEALPLQSPGACAYLSVRAAAPLPYLRFRLGGSLGCRLFIHGAALAPADGDTASRLILPMTYEKAAALSAQGQAGLLDAALAEGWWREGLESAEVLLRRTPRGWGEGYTLYRDSMNATMTARFMRHGRIAHRSPYARRLFLAGSSTHPGQWISFCAISGVLAAEALLEEGR
jgi:phytoene dehydrogenase-like protein